MSMPMTRTPVRESGEIQSGAAMSSMIALGLTLEKCANGDSHAADMLGLSGTIGTLRPGVDADVTCWRRSRPLHPA